VFFVPCRMILSFDDFLTLRHELPVVDVRSEGEFEAGHIQRAVNIPLLNNGERILVGTDYKQKGQLEAVRTGFRLVGPRLDQIIERALQVAHTNSLIVHCWRGGMRSANFGAFVTMAGMETHILKGGYKAYRHKALETLAFPFRFKVVGGCTGSGKTEILHTLAKAGEQVLDLEGLARHKGSVFGGLMMPVQPTSEQFQNDLFEEILQLDVSKPIWIEDESIAIGHVFLPESIWRTLNSSPILEIDVPREVRVGRLVNEYGHADKAMFLKAMEKITKRLGGQHFSAAKEKLFEGDMASVIDILLTYYDKAYVNGLERKKQRIVNRFSWDGKNVYRFVEQLRQSSSVSAQE
jgi:tRNA 2-selenouridine synthase